MSVSNILSLKLHLSGRNTFPATLKNLSTGTDDAGIHRKCGTIFAIVGHFAWLLFQKLRGSASSGKQRWRKVLFYFAFNSSWSSMLEKSIDEITEEASLFSWGFCTFLCANWYMICGRICSRCYLIDQVCLYCSMLVSCLPFQFEGWI